MFLNHQNYEVKRTTTPATVPSDPLSRLRYFLNCLISVVPGLNEDGKLSEIINYQRPLSLNNAGIDAVINLCKTLFQVLNGKCIFQAPELCELGN